MYHILVVDDEVRIRSIIKKYAEFEGHTITEAGDGMEAVRLCRKDKFDLIIMDIMNFVVIQFLKNLVFVVKMFIMCWMKVEN